MNIKEFIEDQIKLIEDPFVAEIHRLMLEKNIQFLTTQALAARKSLNMPQVIAWGRKKYPDWWDHSTDDKKINHIFLHNHENKNLSDVRAYTDKLSTDVDEDEIFYDIPEISNGFLEKPEGVRKKDWFGGAEHLEDLLNSQYFRGFLQEFLKGF